MNTWPVDNKTNSFSVKTHKKALRQTSSAGYMISGGAGTVAKKEFSVVFDYLSYAEKSSIETFFDNNQGVSFYLNSPDTNESTVYTVIFNQDEIDFTIRPVFPTMYMTEIMFREI